MPKTPILLTFSAYKTELPVDSCLSNWSVTSVKEDICHKRSPCVLFTLGLRLIFRWQVYLGVQANVHAHSEVVHLVWIWIPLLLKWEQPEEQDRIDLHVAIKSSFWQAFDQNSDSSVHKMGFFGLMWRTFSWWLHWEVLSCWHKQ